jgi:hypothetical protein
MRNIKKTSISFFMVGILLIVNLVVIGNGKNADDNCKITKDLLFTTPNLTQRVIEEQTYETLNVNGANRLFYHPGQPLLPMYSITYTLPFGTKITQVEFESSVVKTMVLLTKILPAPQPVLQGMGDTNIHYPMDETIYNSTNLFPNTWFTYYTNGGLDSNYQHKTYLTLQVYPARYNPATNIVNYIENCILKINYVETKISPFPSTEVYDLVLITPSKFTGDLEKLVEAKTSHGVSTMMKTTEDIYNEFSGVDKPEQIKYFIKYAIETWGTKYILLIGGMDSIITGVRKDDTNQGSKDWLVPVRYTNLRDSNPDVYDPGFISDLYYADIYNGNGTFSSWDSNHDGIYARWDQYGDKDFIDLFPDVAIGRLACRNNFEVKIMVNKIINYEKQSADPSWFNKIILVGGDTHQDSTNIIEGEYVCNYIYNHFMSEFTSINMFASNKDTNPDLVPTAENLVREISKGSGYLLFDGYGTPKVWKTHYPGDFTTWVKSIKSVDLLLLNNGGKLPITIIGGSHNSLFNITLLSTLTDWDNSQRTWCYGSVGLEDFSWLLTRKICGGSIATIGSTGFGYGVIEENGNLDGDGVNDPDCVEGDSGYLERMFFQTVNEGVNILGDLWTGTLTKFLITYPGMADLIDCKTVEQWPILGDPSLKIGGYPA